MSDKGIIFSAAMVRALLDGRKTQTRRLAKLREEPKAYLGVNGSGDHVFTSTERWGGQYRPPYAPGDRLYVRERGIELPGVPGGAGDLFRHFVPATPKSGVYWSRNNGGPGASYSVAGCSYEAAKASPRAKVRPSIHMPRWASRLWLEVTDVRVQRVQEISDVDAIAEGIMCREGVGCADGVARDMWFGVPQCGYEIRDGAARQAYFDLWDSLHNPRGLCAGDEPNGVAANPWVVAVSFAVHRGNIDRADARREEAWLERGA